MQEEDGGGGGEKTLQNVPDKSDSHSAAYNFSPSHMSKIKFSSLQCWDRKCGGGGGRGGDILRCSVGVMRKNSL